jgi:uncharacterized membrane protein
METKKTSTGLQENVAGLLCYVVGWITGIVFLILEPQNKFIRFHALQSILVFGFLTVVGFIVGFLPAIGGFLNWAVGVVGFILWIVLMVKAYQGTKYKMPVAGDMADKWAEGQSQPPQPPAPK